MELKIRITSLNSNNDNDNLFNGNFVNILGLISNRIYLALILVSFNVI